jgi:hypothetical protein
LTGLGGHGLPTRSTGHVGPAETVPCRPVATAGGDALRGGVGLVEAAGDAHTAAGDEAATIEDVTTEGKPGDVTLGEMATAAPGEVDRPQAVRASRPSNAGRDTIRYRISRHYSVAIPTPSRAVEQGD